MKYRNSINNLFIIQINLLIILCTVNIANCQSREFKKSSITTGIGLGINEGKEEIGIGAIYSVGWQSVCGSKEKIRINPNVLFGGFLPFGILDTRDQYYKLTSLRIDFHYDISLYQSLSIVTSIGGFVNYSRGLLGTGGFPEAGNNLSEYFHTFYFGGTGSIALRINPKNSIVAYEIRPFNIQVGNNYFILSYIKLGIDIKLRK